VLTVRWVPLCWLRPVVVGDVTKRIPAAGRFWFLFPRDGNDQEKQDALPFKDRKSSKKKKIERETQREKVDYCCCLLQLRLVPSAIDSKTRWWSTVQK
jgi:hypothetical protein